MAKALSEKEEVGRGWRPANEPRLGSSRGGGASGKKGSDSEEGSDSSLINHSSSRVGGWVGFPDSSLHVASKANKM